MDSHAFDIILEGRRGTLILGGIVGSTAYGLAGQHSDEDRAGVFIAPLTDLLVERDPTEASIVSHEPDITLHELGKFVRLAVKANPTVSELLWLDHYDVITPAGQALVDARGGLLSANAVRNSYVGYAVSQLKRLERGETVGKRRAKWGRHCARLHICGQELLRTGELTVNVSEWRDEIFGAGELAERDTDAFIAWYRRKLDEMNTDNSPLPAQVDMAMVHDLLIELRVGGRDRAELVEAALDAQRQQTP